MLHFVEINDADHWMLIKHSLDIYVYELLVHREFSDYATAKRLALKEVMPFADRTKNDIFAYHLVTKSGEKIGYLFFSIYPEHSFAFLGDIYIYSQYRQQGYGKQVMALFEKTVKGMQLNAIMLFVFKNNLPAVKLYHRCDYFIAEECQLHEAQQISRYRMVKKL